MGASQPKKHKYAFLDRDGTLIFEPQDTYQIDSLDKLQILDGVLEGLRLLIKRGYRLVMVTNQDSLGTPSFPREDFQAPHKSMLDQFRAAGINFESVFICPHRPDNHCSCRKPKTGLIHELLTSGQVDRQHSFVCGDRDSDRGLANNAGLRFVPMPTNGNFYQAIQPLVG